MSTLPTYHIYADTVHGRKPFTFFVFGPYQPYSGDPEWDVEIWENHITDDQRFAPGYVTTVSSLKRDSHIIVDVWPDFVNALYDHEFSYQMF